MPKPPLQCLTLLRFWKLQTGSYCERLLLSPSLVHELTNKCEGLLALSWSPFTSHTPTSQYAHFCGEKACVCLYMYCMILYVLIVWVCVCVCLSIHLYMCARSCRCMWCLSVCLCLYMHEACAVHVWVEARGQLRSFLRYHQAWVFVIIERQVLSQAWSLLVRVD